MRRLNDDQGAVAVIVAVLMVALLGVTAIVVDVGAAYAERRQLQNGADAGALAIAQDCATLAVACATFPLTAEDFAEDNVNDGSASADLPDLDLVAQTVTVRTTDDVQHWFAPILGIDESTIAATAKAVWGSPSGGPAVLPITFGECVFNLSGVEQWIKYQTADPTECVPPLGDLPGAFAWLETPDGSTCGTDIEAAPAETPGAPGNSFPGQCLDEVIALRNEIVLIPIFTNSGGTGSGVWYGITGFAAFRLTGYRFGGTPNLNWQNTGPGGCTGNCRGVRGHFEEFVTLEDFELGPPNDFGTVVVKLELP